jgi:hypothetical protein
MMCARPCPNPQALKIRGRRLTWSRNQARLTSLLICGCLSALPTRSTTVQPQSQQEQNSHFEESVTSRQANVDLFNQEASQKAEHARKNNSESRGAFVIAPLPIESPALGSGIISVVAYIFPLETNEKVSPPSVIGPAGLLTDNGSRGLALGGELYFKQNTYQTTAIYLRGNLNYDLYGLGSGTAQARLPLMKIPPRFLFRSVSPSREFVVWNFTSLSTFVTD